MAYKLGNGIIVKSSHQILSLRHEEAQLLGYKNFVELSLIPKMVHKPQEVIKFLQDLITRVRPVAARELQQLREFAKNYNGQSELAAWDIAYYSEKCNNNVTIFREKCYDLIFRYISVTRYV